LQPTILTCRTVCADNVVQHKIRKRNWTVDLGISIYEIN